MTAPLVSVIIPNYNYGRYLAQAIESVLAQSYPQVEIIVVNDGSTDDSAAVLRGYGGRIRWFEQPNLGVSIARNRGIKASLGSLVAFLDADDLWHPEKLVRQVELMRDPKVGMVYCGLQNISQDGCKLDVNLDGRGGRVLTEVAMLQVSGVPASGSSALVRRECFERVGLFDARLSTAADWDMWRRIACHYDIGVIREPLVSYRLHPLAMHLNVDLLERDMLYAFAKMFADPAAQEVHALRHRCYSKLYLILSGSHLHAGRLSKCLKYAAHSLLARPTSAGYLILYPARCVRRRLRPKQTLGRLTANPL